MKLHTGWTIWRIILRQEVRVACNICIVVSLFYKASSKWSVTVVQQDKIDM